MIVQRSESIADTFRMVGRMTYRDNEQFNAIIAALPTAMDTVTLDMGELEFIDSFGIGLLLVAADEAKRHRKALVLRNLRGDVQRIFKLANLDTVFTMGEAAAAPPRPPRREGLGVSDHGVQGDGTQVVALSGRFTFADDEAFRELVSMMLERPAPVVVLDLSRLDFMDSAGLSMLLIARDELSNAGRVLQLRSPTARVAQLLTIAAMDTLVDIRGHA